MFVKKEGRMFSQVHHWMFFTFRQTFYKWKNKQQTNEGLRIQFSITAPTSKGQADHLRKRNFLVMN